MSNKLNIINRYIELEQEYQRQGKMFPGPLDKLSFEKLFSEASAYSLIENFRDLIYFYMDPYSFQSQKEYLKINIVILARKLMNLGIWSDKL